MNQSVNQKQRLALVTLVKELMEQLNEVATLKGEGKDSELSMQVFREMALVLEFIPPHLQDAYLELLPTLVTGSNMRRKLSYSKEYVEGSLPSKRRFIAEVTKALDSSKLDHN